MKKKCETCGRRVGVLKGVLAKHRVGRSKPTKVRAYCSGGKAVEAVLVS